MGTISHFAFDEVRMNLTLAEIEKNAMKSALKKFGNTRQAKKAADSLGMSRSTFYRKIKDLGLDTKIPK